jgi:hypothetical protein
MKQFILLSMFAVMSVFANAQDKDATFFKQDATSGDYYYEEVVEISGVKKEEIYDRAKKWVVANFKTADNNISFNDQEMSIVNSAAVKIDKKMFTGVLIQDGAYDFKFHVWVKDGKYKVRVDNIMYYLLIERSGGFAEKGLKNETYAYGDLKDNKWSNYVKKQSADKTASVLAVMKDAVQNNTAPAKKDDW